MINLDFQPKNEDEGFYKFKSASNQWLKKYKLLILKGLATLFLRDESKIFQKFRIFFQNFHMFFQNFQSFFQNFPMFLTTFQTF